MSIVQTALEANSFETDSLESNSLEPSSFEPSSFETGPFNTGSFDIRPFDSSEKISQLLIHQSRNTEASISELVEKVLYQTRRTMLHQPQVSRLFCMSSRTLSRRLKSEGTNFREISERVRINTSKDLLVTGAESINSIARILGYADTSNFTKAFKRSVGLTPGTYRRQYANASE